MNFNVNDFFCLRNNKLCPCEKKDAPSACKLIRGMAANIHKIYLDVLATNNSSECVEFKSEINFSEQLLTDLDAKVRKKLDEKIEKSHLFFKFFLWLNKEIVLWSLPNIENLKNKIVLVKELIDLRDNHYAFEQNLNHIKDRSEAKKTGNRVNKTDK